MTFASSPDRPAPPRELRSCGPYLVLIRHPFGSGAEDARAGSASARGHHFLLPQNVTGRHYRTFRHVRLRARELLDLLELLDGFLEVAGRRELGDLGVEVADGRLVPRD